MKRSKTVQAQCQVAVKGAMVVPGEKSLDGVEATETSTLSPARARDSVDGIELTADAIPADPGDRKGRVSLVADMMALGLWQRGKTAPLLVEAWGVTKATAASLSAEASRFVDLVTGDRERIPAFARSRLIRIAMQEEAGAGAQVAAIRTLLEHMGELRQRHLVTPARDALAELTDEELEAFAVHGVEPARLKGKDT